MKKYIFLYAICILSVIIIPLTAVKPDSDLRYTRSNVKLPSRQITTYIKSSDEVVTMDLEEYLFGVVSAEMPASFELEALKAQAVAARTYVINRVLNGDKEPHKGADVCTDPAHCKAWISTEERMKKWSASERDGFKSKITAAVNDTAGVIMTYDGNPITAVFYAISSGKTENSKDVWGGDLPYLKSVSSPYDKNAPGYLTTAEFSLSEFKNKIKSAFPEAVFQGNPSAWYKNEKRSEGGGVISCEVGGVTVKGTKMRTLFDLRSHNFTLEIKDKVIFTVKGYGHGVGMSQWGANFYAKHGKNYKDILRTYYSGIEFESITD